MRRLVVPLLMLAIAAPALAQRRPLGTWYFWGAFRDNERCYAIAEPAQPGEGGPFASIGWWPGRGIGGQLHVRLGREKRPGSAVLLRIDGRTFQLLSGPRDAWAPDARADAEIVAAMRSGVDLTVETRSARGTPMRDLYRLRGAATAIDAAAIACRRR
ncbi:MAG: hypothetical protein QOI38_2491 [Sphingomonadales bacterium]|jgi:hypothetical protein|nr:hypothetical protein [Sphingomonadales bacterium]